MRRSRHRTADKGPHENDSSHSGQAGSERGISSDSDKIPDDATDAKPQEINPGKRQISSDALDVSKRRRTAEPPIL